MLNTMKFIYVVAFVMLALIGCDDGVKPPAVVPTVTKGTFSGVVRFVNWDSSGTVVDLRLVAFKHFPPGDIIQEVLQGGATVYPALGEGQLAPVGTDSLQYNVTLPAQTYDYVVVAQQFGPDVMADWRPVGQYDLDSNLTVPSPVVVQANDTTRNIDILVDFTHLPPPPF